MSEEKTTFKIDLDNEEFAKKGQESLEIIEKIGDADNLKGLLSGLEEMGATIAIIMVAVIALKESFDAVFNAEDIKSINEQFKIFSELAGVATDKLKEGLAVAANGLADDTDLLKAANKAMLELSAGVERLPELLELSRKSALVMGGTMIEQFEGLSRAIASGNQRGLKQAGIILDVQKAYRDYAVSIGITVNSLSQAEKQQALMNAVLETGSSKLSGVNGDLKPVTAAWTQFKVALQDARESFELIIDKFAGGAFKTAFQYMGDTFKALNIYLKRDMGEGIEGLTNKSAYLTARLDVLREKIAGIRQEANSTKDVVTKWADEDDLKKLQHEYTETLKQASAVHAQMKANEKDKATPTIQGDPIKRAQEEAAAAKSLEDINAKIATEEKKNISSISQADKAYTQDRITRYRQVEAQMMEVESKRAAGTISTKNADQQLMALERLRQVSSVRNEKELMAERNRALDNYLAKSRSTFDGIGRGFEVMSSRNKLALKDFGNIGDKTAKSFGSHMSGAFRSIGDGSKSATDALAGAFEGMVGDMASQYGEMMFLASVWPPNPVGMAAGAALMTLGGMLGGMASGGSTSASGSYGGSGADSFSNPTPLAQAANQTTQNKSVTLLINGPMLMSDQTSRWLVDQVRNAADATDFTIQSVGGGF